MKAIAYRVDPERLGSIVGLLLCHDVARPGGRGTLFRKGHIFVEADLTAAATLAGAELHLMELGPHDVHEDEAGFRLARAIAGPGVRLSEQKQSRIHLLAEAHGLLSIAGDAITALNQIEGVCIYTLYDGLVVDPKEAVAAAKAVPLAVPETAIRDAERIAADRGPVVRVDSFRPIEVAVIAREDLDGKARDRFEASLRKKVGWFGSRVAEIVYAPAEAAPIAHRLRAFAANGAGLILTAGANAVDPLDPVLRAVGLAGGEFVQFGAPAHPGSLIWLADLSGTPILGLASCGMFSQATSADLILPRIFAGQPVGPAEISRLGAGGLLRRDQVFRFPRYDGGAAPEAI